MYEWELDSVAELELGGLSLPARKALAEFMDAVVLVDPAEYQREPGEASRSAGLRTLSFGPRNQGLVTFLIYPPDDLVLVVKIQWLGD